MSQAKTSSHKHKWYEGLLPLTQIRKCGKCGALEVRISTTFGYPKWSKWQKVKGPPSKT